MTSLLLAFILLSGDAIEPQWPAVCDDIHILHGGRTVEDTCLIATLESGAAPASGAEEEPDDQEPAAEAAAAPLSAEPCPKSERELALWTRPLSFIPLPPGLMSWHCLKP
jgi:hypothetical protein